MTVPSEALPPGTALTLQIMVPDGDAVSCRVFPMSTRAAAGATLITVPVLPASGGRSTVP